MAEVVQQRIEDRIPELEQLERVGLFTKKEVKVERQRSVQRKIYPVDVPIDIQPPS